MAKTLKQLPDSWADALDRTKEMRIVKWRIGGAKLELTLQDPLGGELLLAVIALAKVGLNGNLITAEPELHIAAFEWEVPEG
tara:strand:- start:2285 stop:2530 length:246 start_codon:yes stop_codon:yes gene_type:complete